jgi:hypothetical protein
MAMEDTHMGSSNGSSLVNERPMDLIAGGLFDEAPAMVINFVRAGARPAVKWMSKLDSARTNEEALAVVSQIGTKFMEAIPKAATGAIGLVGAVVGYGKEAITGLVSWYEELPADQKDKLLGIVKGMFPGAEDEPAAAPAEAPAAPNILADTLGEDKVAQLREALNTVLAHLK